MKLKHTRRLFVRLLPAGPRGVLLLFETLWQCISIFIYREEAFWVFLSLSRLHTASSLRESHRRR